MGCVRLDILDEQYYGEALRFTSAASTFWLKMSERSGDIFLAQRFSFASFSFVATKENEEAYLNFFLLYQKKLLSLQKNDVFNFTYSADQRAL